MFKVILFTFLFFENLSFYEKINKYLVERGYGKRINQEVCYNLSRITESYF